MVPTERTRCRPLMRRWLVLLALLFAIWQVAVPALAAPAFSHPCCDTPCDEAMPCGVAGCPVCVDRLVEGQAARACATRFAEACPAATSPLAWPAPVEAIWKPPKVTVRPLQDLFTST